MQGSIPLLVAEISIRTNRAVRGANDSTFVLGFGYPADLPAFDDALGRVAKVWGPTRPDAAEELERAVTELGLKALKLLAPTIPVLINDTSLYPVWETCERLGIPVLCHFGMLGAAGGVSYHPNISPAVLEPVARDFPTVDFVIPHFGIQHVTDLLFLCWSCPNVSVDSSGSNQWVRWMPYKLTLDDLFQRFYETIGPERILFGSDAPVFDPRPSYALGVVYLGLLGSVVTFPLYYGLVRKVGAGQAAYSSVIVPVVAMTLSTVFEGYAWGLVPAAGATLALGGMFVALQGRAVPPPERAIPEP